MKCLIFDRNDGVFGIGLEIEYGGIPQFSIAWPDRPPERMTKEFLDQANIKVAGECSVGLPPDPALTVPSDQASETAIPPVLVEDSQSAESTLQTDLSQI